MDSGNAELEISDCPVFLPSHKYSICVIGVVTYTNH